MERRGASGGGDELTRLINAFYGSVSGQAAPSWRDVDELYAAMRGVVARIRRRRGAAGPDTTDLLHRAWQRVMPFDGARARAAQPRWAGREEFFAAVANATVQSLVDDHRSRAAAKRGGGGMLAPLQGEAVPAAEAWSRAESLQDLDEDSLRAALGAVERLGRVDPRAETVVILKAVYGLGVGEIAAAIGVSERTVKRDWRSARAWLFQVLSDAEGRVDDDAGGAPRPAG